MSESDLDSVDVVYPESDGMPMGETSVHIRGLLTLYLSAEDYFRDVADICVHGNLFVYFEKGKPSQCAAPDFFAARGATKLHASGEERATFKVWEEGTAPWIVVEIISKSTYSADLEKKRELYQKHGVKEYFIFDPKFDPTHTEFGDLEDVPMSARRTLRGFRLEHGEYVSVEPEIRGDGTWILSSEVLGLELHALEKDVSWADSSTGEVLTPPTELRERYREAREQEEAASLRADSESRRANSESRRADAAEDEVARLQAENARLRGESAD